VSVSERIVKFGLTFGEVMGKSLVSCFLDSQCCSVHDGTKRTVGHCGSEKVPL